jgi:hypothetical protein
VFNLNSLSLSVVYRHLLQSSWENINQRLHASHCGWLLLVIVFKVDDYSCASHPVDIVKKPILFLGERSNQDQLESIDALSFCCNTSLHLLLLLLISPQQPRQQMNSHTFTSVGDKCMSIQNCSHNKTSCCRSNREHIRILKSLFIGINGRFSCGVQTGRTLPGRPVVKKLWHQWPMHREQQSSIVSNKIQDLRFDVARYNGWLVFLMHWTLM